jgi:hypothetical protein
MAIIGSDSKLPELGIRRLSGFVEFSRNGWKALDSSQDASTMTASVEIFSTNELQAGQW